jgi:putative membrane protein
MKRNPMLAIGLAGALALTAGAALAQDKTGKPDRASQKFVSSAMQGDMAEIDMGKLAQEKGQSQAVKDYGAMLVQEHGSHLEKAKQLASQLGVKEPSGASVSQKAGYLKMKMLSGASFDKAFAKDMVKDHQADIKEDQQQASKGGAAASFAQETLPTLQTHLQKARQLQQQLAAQPSNEKSTSGMSKQ